MVQSLNLFTQGDRRGRVTLGKADKIINCRIDSAVTADVPFGTAVKLVNHTSGVPIITPTTAKADKVFGYTTDDFITASTTTAGQDGVTRSGGSAVKVAIAGTVVVLEAGEAVASGADVAFDNVTGKVDTAVSTNYVSGSAITQATADGDLIRVELSGSFGQVMA